MKQKLSSTDDELDLTPEEEPTQNQQDREGDTEDEGIEITEDTLDTKENDEDEQEDDDELLTSCADVDFSGFWNLTTDLEEQSFTPPYANQELQFNFESNGTVNFTEKYIEPETGSWAESRHKGKWAVSPTCGFTYNGTAEGTGFDKVNNSQFTLYLESATGRPSPKTSYRDSGKSEAYVYANGDTMTQVVYGTFEATVIPNSISNAFV